MSELATAPAAETPVAAPNPAPTPPAIERDWDARSAAQYLASRRNKQAEQAAPVEAAPPPEPRLAVEANAAPQAEAPSEVTEATEPAELPPIDPPRSWTQAEKERFQSLPRETQEYLHTREQEREREFRRSQNEAAEIRKASEAAAKAAEEARQKYEAQLPALMQALQDANAGSFSDVRTVDDVTRLAQEDPFRYLQWQAHQQKLAAVQEQMRQAEGEKSTKKQAERNDYVAKQHKLLVELIPDYADEKKAADLRERSIKMLEDDLGFSRDDLGRWWNSDTGFEILNDARWQKLIADRLEFKKIEKAKETIAAKPLPPVQRPSVGKPVVNSNQARIEALNKRMENESGVNQARTMAEIRQLRKAGAR